MGIARHPHANAGTSPLLLFVLRIWAVVLLLLSRGLPRQPPAPPHSRHAVAAARRSSARACKQPRPTFSANCLKPYVIARIPTHDSPEYHPLIRPNTTPPDSTPLFSANLWTAGVRKHRVTAHGVLQGLCGARRAGDEQHICMYV